MHAHVAKSTNRDHLPLRDFIINARGTRTVGVQCVQTIISDIRVSINVEEKPSSGFTDSVNLRRITD